MALDIGSTKVACAIGLPQERSRGFELLGSSLVPYPNEMEVWLGDPLLVTRTIEQALDAAGTAVGCARALVAFTHPRLAGERVRTSLRLGDEPVTVRAQDVKRLKRAALDATLGIDREPLVTEPLGYAGNGFDEMRDPCGLSATRLLGTYHVVTMPIAVRQALIQAVEAAGLEVIRLTHTLAAVCAALADAGLLPPRALLVDVGGLSTDLGRFTHGVFEALEVAAFGGIPLASTIARELRLTVDQAERLSREGLACRRPEVRAVIERECARLRQAFDRLLQDQPRPDALFIAGRGGLCDGLAEWMEQVVEVPVSVCRSPRVNQQGGDLAHHVGLTAAVGLLAMATQASPAPSSGAPRFFNRLLGRTRAILTEYF